MTQHDRIALLRDYYGTNAPALILAYIDAFDAQMRAAKDATHSALNATKAAWNMLSDAQRGDIDRVLDGSLMVAGGKR